MLIHAKKVTQIILIDDLTTQLVTKVSNSVEGTKNLVKITYLIMLLLDTRDMLKFKKRDQH